jgi:hypothetical protein
MRTGIDIAALVAAVQRGTAIHAALLFVVFAIGLLTSGPASAQSPPNSSLSELGHHADRRPKSNENYLGKALLRG